MEVILTSKLRNLMVSSDRTLRGLAAGMAVARGYCWTPFEVRGSVRRFLSVDWGLPSMYTILSRKESSQQPITLTMADTRIWDSSAIRE